MVIGRFVIGIIGRWWTGCGTLSSGRFPVGGIHSEFAHIFIRMEYDDVNFGHVETHQSYGSAQTDCQTHGRYLNLIFNVNTFHVWMNG